MFGGAYGPDCKAFDRPKYGCLNISGSIVGVKSATRYGSLFMILHQHVRYRATFFDRDTGAFRKDKTLASNEYYAHVLMNYQDNELMAALGVCSLRLRGAPCKCSIYKEVQIHGPVCLASDVQALSVPGREKEASDTLKQNVTKFQQLSKCNILWQQDLLDTDD
jgi:hypothetical protein